MMTLTILLLLLCAALKYLLRNLEDGSMFSKAAGSKLLDLVKLSLKICLTLIEDGL